MTKTLFATLFASMLFSATAAMANTSADTAPDRLPATPSSATPKSILSAKDSAAIASIQWEGGQAGSALPSTMGTSRPMARTAGVPAAGLLAAAPYQFGAAN